MCRPRALREQVARDSPREFPNKDTFFPDVKVKSMNLHDTRRELLDKIYGRRLRLFFQGVLSRASFHRQPFNDQKTFKVLSVHIDNVHAEKRCTGAHPFRSRSDA